MHVEAELERFKAQPGIIQICCRVLNETSSDYSLWFACQTLEVSIRCRWESEIDKDEVRVFLFQYLIDKYESLATYVTRKLSSVIAEIAKQDWPGRYLDYFPQIKAVIARGNRAPGLALLLVTVEEFSSDNSGMTTKRKSEIRSIFLCTEFLAIMNLLSKLLRERISSSGDSTISTCFKIIIQLMAWVPISESMTPCVTHELLRYISCFESPHSVEALTCLNELLEKKFVPKDTAEFVIRLSSGVLENLENLIGDSSAFERVAEDYVNQYTRYISLFLKQHLRKLESTNFPMDSFMELLVKYTLRQSDVDDFMHTLDIWEFLCEYTQNKCDVLGESPPCSLCIKYTDLLTYMLPQLVDRLLWSKAAPLLDQLSDDPDQDSSESHEVTTRGSSDIERYLDRVVELVTNIAFIPNPISSRGVQPLVSYIGQQLETNLSTIFAGNGTDKNAADCASLLAIVGKMTGWFSIPELFVSMFNSSKQFFTWAYQVCELSNQHRWYSRGSSFERLHVESLHVVAGFFPWFVQVASFLENGSSVVNTFVESPQVYVHYLDSIVKLALQTLDTSMSPAPEPVMLAAVQLVSQYGKTIQSPWLCELPCMTSLFPHLSVFLAGTPLTVQQVFYVAMSNSITTPFSRCEENDEIWSRSSQAYRGVIGQQVTLLLQKCEGAPPEMLRAQINILTAIAKSVESSTTKTRNFVALVVTPAFSPVLDLVGRLLQPLGAMKSPQSDPQAWRVFSASLATARDGLEFVVSILTSFSKQIGTETCHASLQRLLGYFSNHASSLAISGSGGVMLLLKLLRLVTAMMSETTTRFRDVVPMVAGLCLEEIPNRVFTQFNDQENLAPAMADNLIDLQKAHYDLLHSLLNQHWKWFLNSDNVFQSEMTQMYFCKAMEVLLNCFQRQDVNPTIYRDNLNFFNDLQNSHKLYKLPLFNQSMKPAFLDTLVKALVFRTHQSLQEELLLTIYGLAVDSMSEFYSSTLPLLIKSYNLGLSDEQIANLVASMGNVTDFPSFSLKLHALTNDVRCTCN